MVGAAFSLCLSSRRNVSDGALPTFVKKRFEAAADRDRVPLLRSARAAYIDGDKSIVEIVGRAASRSTPEGETR